MVNADIFSPEQPEGSQNLVRKFADLLSVYRSHCQRTTMEPKKPIVIRIEYGLMCAASDGKIPIPDDCAYNRVHQLVIREIQQDDKDFGTDPDLRPQS